MSDSDGSGVSRRGFLGALGAAGAAAGCSGAPKVQKLIPFLVAPADIVPGKPLFYRTVCRECSAACGLTARTREGRTIKLEGNPADPIGRGALCARGQASLQALYDPERLRGPLRRDAQGRLAKVGWDEVETELAQALDRARAKGPLAIRLVTRSEPGSAGALQRAFLSALKAAPEARVVFEPLEPPGLREASQALYGRRELPAFDLSRARSIVSFGADFVESWLSPVELARGLSQGRGRVGPERVRFTWVGPRLSLTGVSADLWLPARPGGEVAAALALLKWLVDPAHGVADLAPEAEAWRGRLAGLDAAELERRSGLDSAQVGRLGQELSRRRPSAVLGPGLSSSGAEATRLAALVQLINHALGNVGVTVQLGLDPLLDPPSPFAALSGLVADMAAGKVEVLLVHHADLPGDLPASMGAAAALARVPLVVSFGDRPDGTLPLAHRVLPDHHPLESFGDVTPRLGVVQLAQATMGPLGDTRAASQVLLELAGKLPPPVPAAFPTRDFWDYFQGRAASWAAGSTQDEAARRAAQEAGGLYTAAPPRAAALQPDAAAAFLGLGAAPPSAAGALDLVAFPTSLRADARTANLPWLQETPDALTNVSWSAWAELAPSTANRLGIEDGDRLGLETAAGHAELTACVYPGLREDAIAVPLGGPEALALLGAPAGAPGPWYSGAPVTVRRTGRRVELPRSPGSPFEEGRDLAPEVSAARPTLARPRPAALMYGPPAHPKHRWSMAVDLDRCTGCQACVVACYAENNVPVMGPEANAMGRNMAWLRVERYWKPTQQGGLEVSLLLMLCQQCTNAPCEPVCPVYATYHTPEGLNAQVYNRCVGTRYCSNNCPYKVRTFNWWDSRFPPPLNLQLNPDVTVRSKGVMEKCTFCLQRIRSAELDAEAEGRPVADGEVTPACAQTCPTQAIVFGDANDPGAKATLLAKEGRGFSSLGELNTLPAITYLARVREGER